MPVTAVRILQQHRGLDLEQLALNRPVPETCEEVQETPAPSLENRPRRISRSSYLNG